MSPLGMLMHPSMTCVLHLAATLQGEDVILERDSEKGLPIELGRGTTSQVW